MSVCLQNEIRTKLEQNFEQNKMNQTNAVASPSTLVLVFLEKVLSYKSNYAKTKVLSRHCSVLHVMLKNSDPIAIENTNSTTG